MWKTVSEDCNLACDYCYYSRVLGRPEGIHTPAPSILDKVLQEYMKTCGSVASVVWQGGEPLLAGLPFFQQVVTLEATYARPRTTISNAIQTNGVLINPEWAQFFKAYRFFVGVSLDGPKEIHNQRRVDAGGRGTFDRVMNGIAWLRRFHVDFNVLTVIGPHNVHHAQELVRFYRDHELRWVQFIPEMAFQSHTPNAPGRYAISAREYGDFLCEVFDRWYQGGKPDLSIRFFDNVVQTYVQLQPDICTMRSHCPPRLVLESNGDIYPCDFYFGPEWKLGNVEDMSLQEALNAEPYARFQQLKPSLPALCQECPWLANCRGGCPRNRDWQGGAEGEVDYFCEAFKQFFVYAHPRLTALAQTVERLPVRGV